MIQDVSMQTYKTSVISRAAFQFCPELFHNAWLITIPFFLGLAFSDESGCTCYVSKLLWYS